MSNPLFPAQDYLPDHHVHSNYFSHNYFYVGGRALPRPQLELNLEPTVHSARHALLHMAPKWSSQRTTWAGLTYCFPCRDYFIVSLNYMMLLCWSWWLGATFDAVIKGLPSQVPPRNTICSNSTRLHSDKLHFRITTELFHNMAFRHLSVMYLDQWSSLQ